MEGAKSMRPALNGATCMKHPLAQEIPAAAASGFTGLELWWDKVVDYLKEHSVKELDALLKQSHIHAIGICPFAFSPFRDTEECRRDIQRGLEIAADIGCPMLTICSYGRPVQLSRRAAGEAYAKELEMLSKMAAKYGIRLAIEPVSGNSVFPGPLETLEVIQRAGNPENLGTLVDTFHYSKAGIDLETVGGLPAEKVFIVHINDSIEGEPEVLTDADRLYPTEGVLDLKGYMDALRTMGYNGYLSVEVFRRAYWEENIETICKRAKAGYDEMVKF